MWVEANEILTVAGGHLQRYVSRPFRPSQVTSTDAGAELEASHVGVIGSASTAGGHELAADTAAIVPTNGVATRASSLDSFDEERPFLGRDPGIVPLTHGVSRENLLQGSPMRMSRQARTSGPFLILLGCIACGDSGAPGNGVDGGTASNSGSGDDSNQGSGASMSGGGDNSGSDTDSDSDDGSNSTSPPGFIPGPYNKLIPTPPSDSSHVHNICVTQIDIDGAGQSRGTVCGFNPNFNDTWAGSEPSTCLGINSCTSTLGGVTYKAPPSVRFEVTSGFPVRLTAVILNCQQSPSVNHAAGCILSNDSASIPTSHETSWDMPNGNTGPSTTLTITQIATSNASSLTSKPPAEWPGSDVLIYDDYGNAVIFKLGVTACSGTGMCQ